MRFRDIQHVVYINLNHRVDRKEDTIRELANAGFPPPHRFEAIESTNGHRHLGTSQSHLAVLEMAKSNDWDHVLVVEDDVMFLNPELMSTHMDEFFESMDVWDVLLLGGNNFFPFTQPHSCCLRVSNCHTSTAYLVPHHYFDTLIQNMKNGIEKFKNAPELEHLYAVDQYWSWLQKIDYWFLLVPCRVVQRPGYSDISKKFVDYREMMMNPNKFE